MVRDAEQEVTSILVVDDDTVWLADLATWLETDGFRVVAISRGQWAIEAVKFHEPDVVILDLELPSVDGLQMLAQLRRRWQSLPVIVMTAFGGEELGEHVRRLGAAAYFDKPFRLEDLMRTLRSLRRPATTEGTSRTAGPDGATA
jgi:DNA-binding response OmpR family regulator